MRRVLLSAVVLFSAAAVCGAEGGNLVSNGSFEEDRDALGVPLDWTTSGNPAVHQRLARDAGRNGGHRARLVCTAFGGDGPDFHAMICQLGKVGVRRGRWYKLTFWAKAAQIRAGGVDVALVNTAGWVPSGLDQGFAPPSNGNRLNSSFNASTMSRRHPAGCKSGSRAREHSGSTTSHLSRPARSPSGIRRSAVMMSPTPYLTAASSAARPAGAVSPGAWAAGKETCFALKASATAARRATAARA